MKIEVSKQTILERVKEAHNLKTDAELARFLGVSPATLSNWKSRDSIDYDLVFSKCEYSNLDWLITGKLAEFAETSPQLPVVHTLDHTNGVPYYDVDFCGGFEIIINDQTVIPAGYINIPQYNKADSWANITGHSMEPLIGHGDMIALKKVEDWRTYMLYGEIYGIMTNEWRTVKRVRKAENPDNIILEPINKDYDKWEIPKDIITGVWQVLGCAKKLF